MPLVSDLIGLGVPAPIAGVQGNTPQNITCAGAATAAGTTIQPLQNVVLLTATTTTAVAAAFSTGISLGTPIYVSNTLSSTVTATVYPPSGGKMNGTTDAVVSLTTGKTAIFIQTTASQWYSFPLTP